MLTVVHSIFVLAEGVLQELPHYMTYSKTLQTKVDLKIHVTTENW